MKNILEGFRKIDTYRWIVCFIGLAAVAYHSVGYVNSGVYYDQAINFRPICIGFALTILSLMPIKCWLNFFSLAYIPICYIFMHFAYGGQWIHDDCEYQYIDVLRYGKLVALLWGEVIIAIIIDMIKNKGYKRILSINPITGSIWLIFCIVLGITCGEYYNAWFIILAFTSLAYVLTDKKNRDVFITAVEFAGLLSFVYVLYKSLRHRPYDTERYQSYFANSNTAGMYFACIIAFVYSRLLYWWKSEKGKKRTILLFVWFLIFGVVAEFVVFNYTRTTIMGMGFSFIVVFIMNIIKKENLKSLFTRVGLMLLTVLLMFYPMFLAIRYIPAYCNAPTYICWEYDPVSRVVVDDPIDSPKYTSIQSFLTLALGKWGVYVDFEEKEEKAVEIDTERDVTNGRTEIWSEYLSRISLKGHFPGNIETDDGEYIYHAHNTYLQVCYQYGIICGIIYILLNGMSFLLVFLTFLFNKTTGDDKEDKGRERRLTFSMFIMGVAMLAQMTECMIHPAYIICFMLYTAISFIMCECSSIPLPMKRKAEKSEA